jgi:outer membrane lipoprotein-sorting protein
MILKQKARSAALTLALVGLGAMGLAGCGGDSATATPVAPTATATTARTANPTATIATTTNATATTAMAEEPTTGTGGANSSDALALLKDSAAAMKNVKTFHIKLAVDSAGATNNIEGDMQLPDMMRLSAVAGGQTIQIIVIGSSSYTQVPGAGDSYIEGPFDPSLLATTSGSTAIGDFAQSATVVGDETIDGASTTHVKFSYDADKAAQAVLAATGTPTAAITATSNLGMADAEMWIEKGTNYTRQFKVTTTTAGTTSTTTVNYSKLNETIDPPIEKPANVTTMPDVNIPTIAVP